MRYTNPSRNDGCWDFSEEGDGLLSSSENQCPIEIYKKRIDGSLRPIATVEDPDIYEGGECLGNIMLMTAAPLMWSALDRVVRKGIIHSCHKPIQSDSDEICLACEIKHVIQTVYSRLEYFKKDALDRENEKD